MHEIPTIDERASIKEAVTTLLNSQNRNYIVTQNGKPAGTLTREGIIKAVAEKGITASVSEVTDKDLLILRPEMSLEQAWHLMQQKNKALMPVMSDGQLTGIVDAENISEFILMHC